MAEKNNLTFDVLSDIGNTVARRFGLVFTVPDDLRRLYLKLGADLERYNGDDSWTLPMPGIFIVDEHSLIRSSEVDPDYTVRPEPEHVIKILKTIKTH